MGRVAIKRKVGLCVDCNDGILKPIVAGRCIYGANHYKRFRSSVARDRADIRSLAAGEYIMSENAKLIQWYEEKMRDSLPICENCGKELRWLKNKQYEVLWHSCQAHILPKSLFGSVKTHPDNHMILFPQLVHDCGCHNTFDSSWDAASRMKIFPVAVERFLRFYHLIIDPEEIRKIPSVFIKAIENSKQNL